MAREYEINKIEIYRVSAESEAMAIEKIKDLDSSAAYGVTYRGTWAGPET
jgi:hypothetical protein